MELSNVCITNSGVNNGIVTGAIIQQQETAGRRMGDLARDLCDRVARRFAELNMDEQIELRERIKTLLAPPEPAKLRRKALKQPKGTKEALP